MNKKQDWYERSYLKKFLLFAGILLSCTLLCAVLDVSAGIGYAINDDIAMRDIASGLRGGTPDGHLIYIRYPLGWFLSQLYAHVSMSIDWYGVFMIGLMIFCLSLVLYRIVTKVRSVPVKLGLAVWTLVLFLPHILQLQWTICATAAGCTAVLFFLTIRTPGKKADLLEQILTVLLLIVCYLIRNKIFWLAAACAFFPVIYRQFKAYSSVKSAAVHTAVIFACILASVAGIEAIHQQAYSSPQWQEFYDFNLQRSLVYDYYGIPDYEEHQQFYESQGIPRTTYTNLKKYSFIHDPEINTENMTAIAEYSKTLKVEQPFSARLEQYWDRVQQKTFLELRIVLILLTVSVFVLGAAQGPGFSLTALSEVLVWIAIQLYLVYKGRFPARIVFAVMLIQVFMFSGLLLQCLSKPPKRKWYFQILPILILCVGVSALSRNWSEKTELSRNRILRNLPFATLREYAAGRPDNLYIYLTGGFSPYTDGFDLYNHGRDHGFMLPSGGWVCRSPLTEHMLQSFGIQDVPRDLVESDHLFIIDWDTNEISFLTESLSHSLGRPVTAVVVDSVPTQDGIANIYDLDYSQR